MRRLKAVAVSATLAAILAGCAVGGQDDDDFVGRWVPVDGRDFSIVLEEDGSLQLVDVPALLLRPGTTPDEIDWDDRLTTPGFWRIDEADGVMLAMKGIGGQRVYDIHVGGEIQLCIFPDPETDSNRYCFQKAETP